MSDSEGVASKVLVGIVSACAGAAAMAFVNQATEGETIDRLAAKEFIESYYNMAVDPSQTAAAWEGKVSRELQNVHENGYSDYSTWWDRWQEVEVRNVQSLEGTRERFTADVRYIGQDGQRHSWQRMMYRLECSPLRNRMPFLACKAENLSLRDAHSWGDGT